MNARLLGDVKVWQLGVDPAAVRCGEILESCGASLWSSQGDGTEAWHTPDLIVSDPTPGSALERFGPIAAVPVVSVATARGSDVDEALRRHYARAPWSVEGWSADKGIRTAPAFGSGTARIATELGGASPGELAALADAGVLACGAPAR